MEEADEVSAGVNMFMDSSSQMCFMSAVEMALVLPHSCMSCSSYGHST